MADVTLTIDAKTAKAITDIQRLAVEQGKFAAGVEETEKKLGGAGKATTIWKDSLETMAVRAGSAVAVLGTLKLAVDDYVSSLKAANTAQESMAQTVQTFIGLQQPGQSDKAIQNVLAAGQKYGLGPNESLSIFQQAQSVIPYQEGQGMKSMAADFYAVSIMELMQAGVDQESAQNIVRMSLGKNKEGTEITPQQAASLAFMGAQKSRLSESEFAKSISATQAYSDVSAGTAAISALSYKVDTPQLRETAQAAGLGLNLPNKLMTNLEKEYDKDYGKGSFAGLNEVERVRALTDYYGQQDQAGLIKLGMTEQLQAKGVSILQEQFPAFESTYNNMTTLPDNLVADTVARQRAESPIVESTMAGQEARAATEVGQFYDEDARYWQNIQLQRGQRLKKLGAGRFTDPESGKPTKFGSLLDTLSHLGGPGTIPRDPEYYELSGTPEQTRKTAGELTQGVIDEQRKTNELLQKQLDQTTKQGGANRNAAPETVPLRNGGV